MKVVPFEDRSICLRTASTQIAVYYTICARGQESSELHFTAVRSTLFLFACGTVDVVSRVVVSR